jgi:hypothetical protein
MGVPIHIHGKNPIRSSAITAVPLFPRRGFVESAASGSFVAGLTTAELPFRAGAQGSA